MKLKVFILKKFSEVTKINNTWRECERDSLNISFPTMLVKLPLRERRGFLTE